MAPSPAVAAQSADCAVPAAPATLLLLQCPECKEGDLDFSIPVYREITGEQQLTH